MKYLLESVVIFLLIALSSAVGRKLVLRELTVPPLVDIRGDVTLSCRFDLGGDRLYSVKWYKDEFEFYRYIPDNSPPCHSLPVPGVTLLNEERCDMENVTLTRLTLKSSGAYRCEVSTEAPNFQTVYKNSNMTVVALPLEEPMVEGVLSSYSLGDSVRALCTSDKSNPPSQLTWFINGVKADEWMEERDAALSPADAQGLYIRTLGLSFVTEKRFFSGASGAMELRCTATVGNRTWSRVVTPTLRTLNNLGLAQEQLSNTAHPITPSFLMLAVSLLCGPQLALPFTR